MRTWLKRAGFVLAVAAALTISEQRSRAIPELALPESIAGWAIKAPQKCGPLAAAKVRVWRGTEAARRVCAAEYGGGPEFTVTVYSLPKFKGAFDALQKWRSQPGKLAFFRGPYFCVVESAKADPQALDRFTLALQRAFGPGDQFRR